mmetsp:Transcript_124741/g.349392  ORF Transcript_124741/g.349392 Transcript_124741/m.349392 type:complete len:212 (-) Transcript_124741:108-743(-)
MGGHRASARGRGHCGAALHPHVLAPARLGDERPHRGCRRQAVGHLGARPAASQLQALLEEGLRQPEVHRQCARRGVVLRFADVRQGVQGGLHAHPDFLILLRVQPLGELRLEFFLVVAGLGLQGVQDELVLAQGIGVRLVLRLLSHDHEEAVAVAEHLALLQADAFGDGHRQEEELPALVRHPIARHDDAWFHHRGGQGGLGGKLHGTAER